MGPKNFHTLFRFLLLATMTYILWCQYDCISQSSWAFLAANFTETSRETSGKSHGMKTGLQAPSQDWLHAQFMKAINVSGYSYQPPNDWSNCRPPWLTYYFPTINTIFTGIPKTGCTNWVNAMLVTEGAIESGKRVNTHFFKMTYSMDKALEGPHNSTLWSTFSFAVIRNPWTRLVSGFQDKVSETSNNHAYKRIGAGMVKRMRNITDKAVLANLYPTFEEFIKVLVLDKGHSDRHFKPQFSIMCVPNAAYHYIVPLEFSDQMEEDVSRKIGRDVIPRGSYDKATSDPRYQQSTLLAREWLSGIDKDLLDQFYEIYKADFVMGNYSNFTDPDFPLPKYS